MRLPHRIPIVMLALAAPGCAIFERTGMPATPQRPTVSSDTNTTAYGTWELEAGVSVDQDFFDTPTTLKYGWREGTELFVGWSPFQQVELPGNDGEGWGDLVLGGRMRLREETDSFPATAVLGAIKLPTGDEDEGLSTGEVDFFAAGIAQKSFEELSLVGFYQLGIHGDPGDSSRDVSHTLALSGGIPVQGEFGAFAELGTQVFPEDDFEPAFLILGGTLSNRADRVVDFGLRLGVGGDGPEDALVIGFTQNIGAWRRASMPTLR